MGEFSRYRPAPPNGPLLLEKASAEPNPTAKRDHGDGACDIGSAETGEEVNDARLSVRSRPSAQSRPGRNSPVFRDDVRRRGYAQRLSARHALSRIAAHHDAARWPEGADRAAPPARTQRGSAAFFALRAGAYRVDDRRLGPG